MKLKKRKREQTYEQMLRWKNNKVVSRACDRFLKNRNLSSSTSNYVYER